MERVLVIVRGAPGSGKSTLAKTLAAQNGAEHYEADMFFEFGGDYAFDHSRLRQAHEWCQSRVEDAMCRGHGVIVSNTFTKKWEMQPYIDMAEKYGYLVQEVICRGDFGNVHGCPDDKVRYMRDGIEL